MNAYPLKWPDAYPRTTDRKKPAFRQVTFGRARDMLLAELKRMGATEVILSTNVPLRGDGLPYADFERRRITDTGVAVYFKWKGQQRVLACDKWNSIENNLHGLELSIAAMRGLERWGASAILERAFTGFTALPAPETWWSVLEVQPDDDLDTCESSYRFLMKRSHPDAGGSEYRASKLNWAIGCAREERRAA